MTDSYSKGMRELGFATLDRERLDGFKGLDVSRATGNFKKPVRRVIELAEGEFLFSIGVEGTLVFGDPSSGDAIVLPARSMLAISGPITLALRAMRGKHHRLEISGKWDDFGALSRWQSATECPLQRGARVKAVPFATLGDEERYISAAVDRILEGAPKEVEPYLIGLTSACMGMLCLRDYEFKLVSVPDDVRGPIHELMLAVKERPTERWSLKEAADLIGYSQFHLSRAFKQEMGYGFPRYADRCRIEIALPMILNTEKSYEEIADEVGYGTVQGLREGCKLFLGSNPSELRNYQIRLRRDYSSSS